MNKQKFVQIIYEKLNPYIYDVGIHMKIVGNQLIINAEQ